jgi:GTP 3',8-cyclase
MPKDVSGRDNQFLNRKEFLTFEEIERVARIFVSLGLQKIRRSGGEPLVQGATYGTSHPLTRTAFGGR